MVINEDTIARWNEIMMDLHVDSLREEDTCVENDDDLFGELD